MWWHQQFTDSTADDDTDTKEDQCDFSAYQTTIPVSDDSGSDCLITSADTLLGDSLPCPLNGEEASPGAQVAPGSASAHVAAQRPAAKKVAKLPSWLRKATPKQKATARARKATPEQKAAAKARMASSTNRPADAPSAETATTDTEFVTKVSEAPMTCPGANVDIKQRPDGSTYYSPVVRWGKNLIEPKKATLVESKPVIRIAGSINCRGIPGCNQRPPSSAASSGRHHADAIADGSLRHSGVAPRP